MNEDERFKELKEKEIIRLTTPVTYKKVKFGPDEAYDCEGNRIRNYKDGMYIIEPKKGLLSDEEILKYAPCSDEASRVRLRLGIADFSDRILLYGTTLGIVWFSALVGLFPGLLLFGFLIHDYIIAKILFFVLLISLIIITIYLLFIKDNRKYVKQTPKIKNESIEEVKIFNNDELMLLFESKEKMAREIIERRFPAPQMTNIKFNSVLDNCKYVVESQIEILNDLTPTEKTKYEIDSRKKLIKQVIGKIDDLTNELILSEENDLEDVIGEMDNLIKSVKDYE